MFAGRKLFSDIRVQIALFIRLRADELILRHTMRAIIKRIVAIPTAPNPTDRVLILSPFEARVVAAASMLSLNELSRGINSFSIHELLIQCPLSFGSKWP